MAKAPSRRGRIAKPRKRRARRGVRIVNRSVPVALVPEVPRVAVNRGIDFATLARLLGSFREQAYCAAAASEQRQAEYLYRQINAALPNWLPSDVRSDVCHEVFASILTGEFDRSRLRQAVKTCVRRMREYYPDRWKYVSIDAPLFIDGRRTLSDVLVG